jgi:hypothetical protein
MPPLPPPTSTTTNPFCDHFLSKSRPFQSLSTKNDIIFAFAAAVVADKYEYEYEYEYEL